MTRRSKLDPYRDQIIEWVRQGKDSRSIQALLKERNLIVSHQNVGIYVKRATAPTLAKVAKQAEVQLGTVEQVMTEAIAKYAALASKEESTMTLDERNYFRTIGEWFDRIAKLRGLYAPQSQVAVGVQVNVGEFREKLWKALNE